eukprot:2621659-Amphidinium_carterae.2
MDSQIPHSSGSSSPLIDFLGRRAPHVLDMLVPAVSFFLGFRLAGAVVPGVKTADHCQGAEAPRKLATAD